MYKEFKEFIMRGNVVDLAVGVVIGAAFGKIVTSFVEDILMPPIGSALGGVDFSNLFINLSSPKYQTLAEAQKAGAPTINYGLFFNNVISFLIVAFVVFLIIKQMNRFRRATDEPLRATDKACPYCITTIPLAATRCPHCTSMLTA